MEFPNYRAKLPGAMKAVFKDRMHDLLYQSIKEELGEGGGYPSSSKKLRSQSGQLADSFKPGNSNGYFSAKISDDGVKIEIGSKLPYAPLHEFGGTLKPSKKMASFFWYKYFSTKNEYFKHVALRVMKGDPLIIKKRPYLEPAIQNFIKKYLPTLVEEFATKIFK